MRKQCILLSFFLTLWVTLLLSDEPSLIPKLEFKEETSETIHSIKIDDSDISYKAVTGTLIQKDAQGKAKASLFYIAYIKEGENDLSKRPITYCFNGGPGSSSVWMHLGTLGPRRIVINEEICAAQVYQLVDNAYSILNVTDLVFIDPVSTGYSRPAAGEDAKQFYGVKEDIQSIAEFIRLYTTKNNRWSSPKFLAGESYGTIRATGLAEKLHKEERLYLNGILLISSVLNYQTLTDPTKGNDLPYVLFLPSYTAAAWHYKKLPDDLQKDLKQTLKDAQDFAVNEYSVALMKGDAIDEKSRQDTIAKLARYTGLSQDYIDRANMRISSMRFVKELLRNEKRTLGRFDCRVLGIDADSCGQFFDYDASFERELGIYKAAIQDYLKTELKWSREDDYKVLANVQPWNYGEYMNQYLNVADDLREVITRNAKLHIFVASGYYDLATPYFGTDYTFNHLGLDPTLRARITMEYYEGGHMMYTELSNLKKLNQDLRKFITSACQN